MIIKPKLIPTTKYPLDTCLSCVFISTEGKWDVYYCPDSTCRVKLKGNLIHEDCFYIYDGRRPLYSRTENTKADLERNRDLYPTYPGEPHEFLLKGARKYYDKYGY